MKKLHALFSKAWPYPYKNNDNNDNFRVGFNTASASLESIIKHIIIWQLYVGAFNMFKYLKKIHIFCLTVFLLFHVRYFFFWIVTEMNEKEMSSNAYIIIIIVFIVFQEL